MSWFSRFRKDEFKAGTPVYKDLSSVLEHTAPNASLLQRLEWLESLLDWLLARNMVTLEVRPLAEGESYARLKFLFQRLKRDEVKRAEVSRVLRSIVRESSFLNLFVSGGLSRNHSLAGAITSRIREIFLPTHGETGDMASLFPQWFRGKADADWLASIPTELLEEGRALFSEGAESESVWEPVRKDIVDAVLVLASEIRALALSDEIRARAPEIPVKGNPGIDLTRNVNDLLTRLENGDADSPEALASAERLRQTVKSCRRLIRSVFEHLNEFGVDVDLVYRLERMKSSIARIDGLIAFLMVRERRIPLEEITAFIADVARDAQAGRTISDLLNDNLRLLARKIVERTGNTGEHYITRDREEYAHMLKGAAGGGVLTSGTAALKFLIGWAKLPVFFELIFTSVNYAGSFLLMQALGFKLATKQPSMTASALAATLHQHQPDAAGNIVVTPEEIRGFTDEVVDITRSQIVAAIGNIGAVIPAAIALDFLTFLLLGRNFLGPATSSYVIDSFDPLGSLVIWYAAITGVLLWMASVCAGWLENWTAYHRIPESIRNNRRFRRFFGPKRVEWLASVVRNESAGIGGNVSLGVLLAFVPLVGRASGLPINVAHVTLSTGALTLAVCSLGVSGSLQQGLIAASVGIVLIGMLNFGVSFACALYVAIRARNVDRGWVIVFMRAVVRRFIKRPWEFLLPPGRRMPPIKSVE